MEIMTKEKQARFDLIQDGCRYKGNHPLLCKRSDNTEATWDDGPEYPGRCMAKVCPVIANDEDIIANKYELWGDQVEKHPIGGFRTKVEHAFRKINRKRGR
jgi:hypothetical protein